MAAVGVAVGDGMSPSTSPQRDGPTTRDDSESNPFDQTNEAR